MLTHCKVLAIGSTTLLLLVSACGSPDLVRLGDARFPPRPPDWQVDILIGPEIERPAELIAKLGTGRRGEGPPGSKKIGGLTSRSEGYGVRPPLEDARAKARSLGGDAVLIFRCLIFTYTGDPSPDGSGYRMAYRLDGYVLRYPERGASE